MARIGAANGRRVLDNRIYPRGNPMNELLFDKAKIAFVEGKYEEAAEAFGEMLSENPENPLALYSRGTARFNMKDFEGAIADYDAYLALNDRSEKVFTSRGAARLALGRNEEAINDFNKSIELNEFYPNAYFGRAEVFTRMGEKEQAKLDVEVGNRILQKMGQSHFEGQGIMFQDSGS